MTTLTLQRGTAERLRAYARLAKLSFFDYYLSALVAVTLAPPGLRGSARGWTTLVVLTVGWVAVVAATVTFDDVTGYTDGSDQVNYDPRQHVLRKRTRKPLLDGYLSVPEALRFAYLAVLVAAVVLACAVGVAPYRPGWAVGLVALVLVMSVQYSYGLKLSYNGGQELVLMVSTGLTVLVPFGLLTGRSTGLALAETYLFGLWSLLVSVYSNINDLDGDRAAGRRNMAVMCSPGAYRVFVMSLVASQVAVAAAAAAVSAAPWWLLLAVVPALAMHVTQVRIGLFAGNPLAARKLGIRAHRWGTAVLVVANLLMVTR